MLFREAGGWLTCVMGIWGEMAGGSVVAGGCGLILGEGAGPVCWAGGEGGT